MKVHLRQEGLDANYDKQRWHVDVSVPKALAMPIATGFWHRNEWHTQFKPQPLRHSRIPEVAPLPVIAEPHLFP